ncbi:DUF4834 family protein [Haloflavibacter putidus]|uniref:DUF4834 family protein n=1 Tax=Haloflavibacter putidus TaxID=2576776 RepID=A0A507ZWR9_9FLAO|nr:DUF4834 family protein [Haloflavibacter putidus]TQD40148.1 DUF4834 family protein [Haloflavibacter putidus]
MYEASFTGVIKTILIILLVYFGVKLFFKWFGPSILKYIMNKVGSNIEKKFREQQGFNNQNHKSEEETLSQKKTTKKTKSNKDVGEYIEYEEID